MARFRLELGPIPLHHQVYLDLKAALDAGEWLPGDRAPDRARPGRPLRLQPHHDPAGARRARPRAAARADPWSRHVRPAPAHRPRLRGRAVVHRGDAASAASTRRRGSSRRARSRRARPSRRALGLELGSPTLYLERLRVAAGEPLLLEQVHLPAERFPGLLASDLEHGSLYDLLTERYGVRVAKAREVLEPVLLRAREARLLDRKPGRRPCSSKASHPPRTGHRSSSAGRSCVGIGPATTWSGWSCDRTGRTRRTRRRSRTHEIAGRLVTR